MSTEVLFSVLKTHRSFTATKELLKSNGVGPIKQIRPQYDGCYSFAVPKVYWRKADRLLSGTAIVETVH